MRVLESTAALREVLSGQRNTAFVPTMGGLHEGHLALVRTARGLGGPVVASVFVNRLQFGPDEDFARYPRQLARDCEMLQAAGCDVVFAPAEDEIYPEPQTLRVVPPASLADRLEGRARPGFFEGVCTVVLKLLSIVGPRYAVFGKKDYQQWRMIETLVRQFALPVEIVAGETVRDHDGLALSSRNAYLSCEDRERAPLLYAVLRGAADRLAGGEPVDAVETQACAALESGGWRPDYVRVLGRNLEAWQPNSPAVIVGAGLLGTTRLIDNLEC